MREKMQEKMKEKMDKGSGMGMKKGSGAGMAMGPKGDQSAPSKAFAEANARMHQGMDITFTGNADVDFVKGMIPHHQGAIDMARVLLQHGKDADLKKLANDIIKAQETEIASMKAWLAKNDPAAKK